ncbi:hypothetical protein ACFL6I_24995, partial [candidate division KSB1 bacterium]
MDLLGKKKKKNTKGKKGSKKTPKVEKKVSIPGAPKLPEKQKFWANLLSTVLIFFILVTAYSL